MTPRPRRVARRRHELLTDEQYDALLEQQGVGCAICGNRPKSRKLSVDHDHASGLVRGLLCYRCNRALPTYVTAEWLGLALAYLARHAETVDTATDGR